MPLIVSGLARWSKTERLFGHDVSSILGKRVLLALQLISLAEEADELFGCFFVFCRFEGDG